MKINIIGAGMAGLLAGNMLRHHDIAIYERQKTLPNNHNALLRFRSTKVSDALNIPFKKVTMVKDVHSYAGNKVADAMMYSWKSTGRMRSDRSILRCPEIAERYIAPSDLIVQMAARVNDTIKFGTLASLEGHGPVDTCTISTIPMPELVRVLDYPDKDKLEFSYRHGVVLKATVPGCDAYCSVYCPDPYAPTQRISLTGDQLIIEMHQMQDGWNEEALITQAKHLLGLPEKVQPLDVVVKAQLYAKIQPIDEDERKRFMFWATDKMGIYSLGRFATWRPGLLLDDLVQDIQLIERWIVKNDRYAVTKHRI